MDWERRVGIAVHSTASRRSSEVWMIMAYIPLFYLFLIKVSKPVFFFFTNFIRPLLCAALSPSSPLRPPTGVRVRSEPLHMGWTRNHSFWMSFWELGWAQAEQSEKILYIPKEKNVWNLACQTGLSHSFLFKLLLFKAQGLTGPRV